MGKNGNADRAGRSTAWARTYKDEKRKAGVRTHLAKRADAGKLSEAQREQQLLQEKREAKEAKAKAFLEQEALWASMYESRVEDQDGDHNEEDQIDDLNVGPTDQCDHHRTRVII
ncbi:hypothetical protein SARC_11041 [Sphaeroforma arctica JP610]|uniref:Uncharacterized protein n=1 Tax=Sphaeroforma arctica JP610 TaxID=667725 RepID=A0A0L0FI41_9EUKA|nr:hypothetical protein SARC_11041 [Sphaeroforma arctica JP610]KNC76457.1 hypothetical protein SARC_11041 [Sphaeroforma arctica JP610]|eukprot:XP_014150359.1 hypothetical protein SARC_11041 [Sphaeroforma arctica JP610]